MAKCNFSSFILGLIFSFLIGGSSAFGAAAAAQSSHNVESRNLSSEIEALFTHSFLTPGAKAQLMREFKERIKQVASQEDNRVSGCPICLNEFGDFEAFGEDGEVLILTCGHLLCKACADQGKIQLCPICREKMEVKFTTTVKNYRELIAANNPKYGEARARKLLEAEEETARRDLWRVLQTGTFQKQASISPDFVAIERGEFTMGSPAIEAGRFDNEDQHQVRITSTFALKKTPVTVKEWREMMGNDPSHRFARPADESADDCPMQMVSWYDAIAYCNRLSIREGFAPYYILTGESGTPGTVNYTFARYEVNIADQRGYRLPREAEWEKAARANGIGARNIADNLLASIAWYEDNSASRTHPVTTLQPNAFGLFHMLGNVWEWTGDWFQEHLGTALQVDPHGPDSGASRVIRGGSYYNYARSVRAAERRHASPSNRCDNLGFRPARSLSY